MSKTAERPIEPRTAPEQQPWHTPEDRQGWKVVAVGTHHPGRFLREVQEYLQRHMVMHHAASGTYRASARLIVEALLGKEVAATTADEVRGIVCGACGQSGATAAEASPSALEALAAATDAAWRRYAAAVPLSPDPSPTKGRGEPVGA